MHSSLGRANPRIIRACLLAAVWVACSASVTTTAAQGAKKAPGEQGGVDRSGMEQGEAVISVRSDVRLAMKGTRGATKSQVTAIGEAIRSEMQRLKLCYGKLVAQDPAAALGEFRMVISFADKKKIPDLEFPGKGSRHAGLEKCIHDSLGKASLDRTHRPAAAILMLNFSNTRARGQALMNQASDPSISVAVKTAEDGSHSASWKTENGDLTFEVTAGPKDADRDTVAAILSGLRGRFGSFLDCRRRAGKRGTSPAGKTVSDLRLLPRGRVKAKNLSSTLKLAPAATCIEKVYPRLQFEGAAPRSRARVTVYFAE